MPQRFFKDGNGRIAVPRVQESIISESLAWGYVRAGNQNTADAHGAVHEANAKIRHLNNRTLTAEAEVDRLRDMLEIAQSEIAGLVAQRTAFKNQDPNSPLLTDSGKRYASDGKMKLAIRIILEKYFDEKAASFKISNPACRRDD